MPSHRIEKIGMVTVPYLGFQETSQPYTCSRCPCPYGIQTIIKPSMSSLIVGTKRKHTQICHAYDQEKGEIPFLSRFLLWPMTQVPENASPDHHSLQIPKVKIEKQKLTTMIELQRQLGMPCRASHLASGGMHTHSAEKPPWRRHLRSKSWKARRRKN